MNHVTLQRLAAGRSFRHAGIRNLLAQTHETSQIVHCVIWPMFEKGNALAQIQSIFARLDTEITATFLHATAHDTQHLPVSLTPS